MKEDYSEYEMINGGQSKYQGDLNTLREEFISKYCKSKGWDVNGLTPEQNAEIQMQREYKNPNIILG